MIEMHGWLSISLSTDGEGEDGIDNAVMPLLSLVDKIHSRQNVIKAVPLNGRYFITILNHLNHKSNEFKETLTLFEFVRKTFSGAYGLLYVKNDEDELGRDNEFVVYKLAKGQIIIEKDYYLSPCNPVIED